MRSYFTKIIFLLIFAFVVIFQYFSIEKSTGFIHITKYSASAFLYFFIVLSIFISYFIFKHSKDKIKYNIWEILGFFLLNLFIQTLFLFGVNGEFSLGSSIVLFCKIIFYLILPFSILFFTQSLGEFILSYIKNFKEETSTFKYLVSQVFGFFVFMFFLTVIGYLGFYNIYVFLILMLSIGALCYKNILINFKKLISLKFEYELEKNNFFIFTKELSFFIIIFILGINYINIVRAFPIGWDDLGVYMNYPKILASNGELSNLGGMMSWQIFTGIGFLFKSPAQAFFLNNVGGFLSIISIILIIGELLKTNKKTFLDIPMILAGIFISLPMIVFQQAKDMKLDSGLFFVSVVSLYIIYYIFIKYVGYKRELKSNNFELVESVTPGQISIEVKGNKNMNNFLNYFNKYRSFGDRDIFENKSYLIYILIAGILSGFAFSIKLTSLLLISGIIGVLFYSMLGFSGLLSYSFLYTGIFTKLKLWGIMNVLYLDGSQTLVNNIFLICLIIGLALLGYSIHKYSFKIFKKFLAIFSLYITGIIIALSFYLTYNISTIETYSATNIISGTSFNFEPDFSKIYSDDELYKIESEYETNILTESGSSTNEDLGRYFGYESGVNNYLKLPYNLTMQVNQDGEFTNITFVFFALIPLLLFLSYKSQILTGLSFVLTGSAYLYLLPSSSVLNIGITNFLSQFNLPIGYLVILLFFFIPLFFLLFSLNKEKFSMLFRLNLVFSFIYVFLWAISSFGIVWYGITMYFSFFITIGIGLYYVSNYNEETREYKFYGSFLVYLIFVIYYIGFLFPYSFSNLSSAGSLEYKKGENLYISIFTQKYDYFKALAELNLNSQEDYYKDVLSTIDNKNLLNYVEANNIDNLNDFVLLLFQVYYANGVDFDLKVTSRDLLISIFKEVYSPSDEYENDSKIYRVGTFFKYFVNNNIQRFYGDSMLTKFDEYFYNEDDIDEGIQKLKDLGIDYMLVDLNAATIDKDSRHDLTRRYENILKTFTSDKIELIDTDSICLQYARDKYLKSSKTQEDLDKFIYNAGVNYESYDENGNVINRNIKKLECFSTLANVILSGAYSDKKYPYLAETYKYVTNAGLLLEDSDTDEVKNQKIQSVINLIYNYNYQTYFAVFKIK